MWVLCGGDHHLPIKEKDRLMLVLVEEQHGAISNAHSKVNEGGP